MTSLDEPEETPPSPIQGGDSGSSISPSPDVGDVSGDGTVRKKGRLRSISATFKPLVRKSSMNKTTNFEALKEAAQEKEKAESPHLKIEGTLKTLTLASFSDSLLNDPALAAFMSETVIPDTPAEESLPSPIPEGLEDSLAETRSISSFEDVAREKIV